MSDKNKSLDYKKIYSYLRTELEKTEDFDNGTYDETYYSMRVYKKSKELIGLIEKKVNEEAILVASLLHDIGKINLESSKLFDETGMKSSFSDEWNKHSLFSSIIAKKYLTKEGYDEKFISEVCYLIENHDNKNILQKDKSLELQILQDADLLADIGIAGFIRPFCYAGKFKKSIIETIPFLVKEDRTQGGLNLNLEISKEIGEQAMQNQKDLVRQISNTLDDELLN